MSHTTARVSPRTLAATSTLATATLLLGACADQARVTAPPSAPGPAALRNTAGGSSAALTEGALYVADLIPMNVRVQEQLDPDPETPRGVVRGTAHFRVVNGNLNAVVQVSGAELHDAPLPEGLHPQHIHAAGRCPPPSADTNGDGIIDVIEGLPFYGDIMIPLDGNINNLTSEIPTFPVAMGAHGTYRYEATGSVARLEHLLGQALHLPRRHVVIHGVDIATPIPSSVQTLPGLPAQVTLPVACGEIRQVR